jgi:hypothetical protein
LKLKDSELLSSFAFNFNVRRYALGQCYESEQLQMTVAAIRCYQRAVTWNDREGIALGRATHLHPSFTPPSPWLHPGLTALDFSAFEAKT